MSRECRVSKILWGWYNTLDGNKKIGEITLGELDDLNTKIINLLKE